MVIQSTPVSSSVVPGAGSAHWSGTVPASGTPTSGHYPGPWFVETQYFSISYARVPSYYSYDVSGNNPDNNLLSLSGDCSTRHVLNWTDFNYQIFAKHQVTKDYGYYATSGHIQPQKLVINASETDQYGQSYGPVTGATVANLCLGPQGTVTTDIEYYFRRPWETGDNEILESDTCCNVAFQFMREQYIGNYHCATFQDYFSDFQKPHDPIKKGSFGGVHDYTRVSQTNAPNLYFSQDYVTSQEKDYLTKDWITRIIDTLPLTASGTANYYSHVPAIPVPQATSYPTPDAHVSGLDSNRIDWS